MHQELCMRCQGAGTVVCPKCNGAGKIEVNLIEDKECPKCNGRGELQCPSKKCNGGVVMVRG